MNKINNSSRIKASLSFFFFYPKRTVAKVSFVPLLYLVYESQRSLFVHFIANAKYSEMIYTIYHK